MKKSFLRLSVIATAASLCLYHPAIAEDIDLFTSPGGTGTNPNVVIMIDNSANWDANNQHWPGVKQGQAELRALRTVVDEVNDKMNMGLMLFTPGSGAAFDGGYVRYHVRQMTATNKAALKELIGSDTCVNGPNSLNTTANCIFNNFSTPSEKVGTAKLDYSAGLFEVFKYFGGYTSPAHARDNVAGSPTSQTQFGPYRYAGNPETNSDPAAYTGGASKTGYTSPINADGSNACAKNFLVFIGNGFPVKDSGAALLTGVGGSATQLSMPQFSLVTNNVTTSLGTYATCSSPAACATAAATSFPGYDTYACSGGTASPDTVLGTDTVCRSPAACATFAQGSFPGYASYSCTGGSTATPQSGTDLVCETAAACATRAATLFPGHTTYACSGGSQPAGVTALGTDPVGPESRTACAARAAILFPGYTSYSCTGGTAGTPIVTAVGNSGLFCENATQCATRVAPLFPGHDSVSCGAGVSGVVTVGTDLSCENATQCKNGITFPTGSNLTSAACSGGTSCGSGGKLVNQTQQGTCSATGAAVNRPVSASDTPYTGQTMQGTGCTAAGRLSGQTMNATDCSANQVMHGFNTCLTNQTISGTKAVNTVTPTGVLGAPTSVNNSDEWAKFLYTTDVNSQSGQQNVSTYTIDVFKDAQDANETALLLSMAKYGGGRYFQATSEQAILNALREILVEIQSVNSVFASASLPINATNRSQNENQVFIGMFRPDPDAKPKWYGNLKRFQVALFGADAKLADSNGNEAIAGTTGFVQACATSYYTTDTGTYWDFSPQSAGSCPTTAYNASSDSPDGGVVEKGAAGEVLRKGNDPTAVAPFTVNRTMYTCASSPCSTLVAFNNTNVTAARTGAASTAENDNIVNFTKGADVLNENGNASVTEPRPSIHGDIAHSRPLPVNFGGSRGVEVFYGSNDGAFHALKGTNGTEAWSFIAPEHHSKLKRLYDNTPYINYPGIDAALPQKRKDYFFDGSAGLYQNVDSTVVWIFPTMRRGGRMMYAFDISSTTPALKWSKGCPNMADDTGCSSGLDGIGQTWSVPNVAVTKGYGSGTSPMLIFGGGYDACEDTDSSSPTCTSTKGNKVYILDADTGALIKSFDTGRSVPADVTLIDRDFDGKVDHVYVADTGGSLYRIDLVDPATLASRAVGAWTITKIAATTGGGRKFLFGPASLATRNNVFLALGSGDRERPLVGNYPYTTPVQNRFYMFIDKFPASGVVDLDGGTMTDFTSSTGCDDELASSQNGWRMDLNSGTGEQTVTSSVIFGGTVFFSTNRPVATTAGQCAANLGEARGYAVNLLNASGVISTGALCGGTRSGTFTGGGLPPSPVVGTVPVQVVGAPAGTTKPISVLIGGIGLQTGSGSPIAAQQPPVPIKQIRSRVYWYPKTGT